MTGFDERERGFEEKYAREQEQTFRLHARRDKLLGLWAAGLMGLEGEAAEAYAMTLVKADLAEPGDDDVIRQARADLAAKGIEKSEDDIRSQLQRCQGEAEAASN
ncbi:MAG: DUF1476 domain-containing protein [Phycisphaerales bacterium]|jgi:hypothetical protein|nr:DUF1476 domain-containing protein [Phycisphaerales bacterium]